MRRGPPCAGSVPRSLIKHAWSRPPQAAELLAGGGACGHERCRAVRRPVLGWQHSDTFLVLSGFCNNCGPHGKMTADSGRDCAMAVGEIRVLTLSSVSGLTGAELPERKGNRDRFGADQNPTSRGRLCLNTDRMARAESSSPASDPHSPASDPFSVHPPNLRGQGEGFALPS